MTIFTLSINNFIYDVEDNMWYYRDNTFRVKLVKFQTHDEFYLYYGGHDNYLGNFTDDVKFVRKIKDYKIKILRLQKLQKIQKSQTTC